MTSPGEIQYRFPPHILREYAMLADGQRGALCGPHGDVVWLCAPRWHDDAVFSALLGGPGVYAITPLEPFVWGGYYEPNSLIWRNRWITTSTIVECREALSYPGDPDRVVLLRRIEAERDIAVRVELDVSAGFGAHRMRESHRDEAGRWTARSGELMLRWTGAPHATMDSDGALRARIEIPAGGRYDLVLELARHRLPEPVDPDMAWRGTETAWRRDVPQPAGTALGTRDARHAYAVLRGMTVPGGGMAAAATMSLPERAEQGRNYDYRYSWIRDQCYAGMAASTDGDHDLLTDATSFITARLLDEGRLEPAYTVHGDSVPAERRLDLPGYPGGRKVVRGNWISDQFQLDTYGEVLQLLARAARLDLLDRDGWLAAKMAVDTVERSWQWPEAGIWELGEQWWTHSRLACVAGLRAIAGIAPSAGDAGRVLGLADAILAETTRRCLHPTGYWQRAPGLSGTDAALVLPPVRGALPASDARTRATLRQVRATLCQDGYVYRFPQSERPLGEDEGAFLLCGFLLALAEHQQGRSTSAVRWWERTRSAYGPPGLLSEEYDVQQRQLRGNLPQAFVHAQLLEASIRLARSPGSAFPENGDSSGNR